MAQANRELFSERKARIELIDSGITPCPFFEGDYTSRLPYLAELPRGKILGLFDSTDIYKAKEALGATMCISGMMPLSLLQPGTADAVRSHAKTLIDVVGKGGGFIMGPRSAMDECNPELVKVWVDFTKEYGVY
jgi:uroporphyrinogen-III decarboxylase